MFIMKIEIENCNNIEKGEVHLTEGALNIKYAINGTGKSTIARAISATVENDENILKTLVPYRYVRDLENHKPQVAGIDNIHSTMVFNEDYVDRYVYMPDEVIKDSFKIFIKTSDYDAHMNEIQMLLKEISVAFQTHPELDELIKYFSMFLDGFGKAKSGYSASGSIGKSIGKGNKINHIPEGLEVYSPYLKHTEEAMNVKWIKWQIDGNKYLPLADQCPYCSNPVESKRDIILKVGQEYDAKSVEHLNKMIQVFEVLMPYFSDDTRGKIHEIAYNISGITLPQKQYLIEVKNQVETILGQLKNLKEIGFYTLKDAGKVVDELKGFIIDLSLFSHLASKTTKEKIDIINASLSVVMEKAGALQGELNKQKKLIEQTIKRNNDAINDFFRCAGYNYEVCVEENDNHEYRMLLKPKTVDEKIASVKQHLSYGERNAFALALFMFAALKENPDLIILDDPISSFDGNKKFAIINMLFLSKNSFKNRTVLLLTHEFNTVIDIIHTMPQYFNPAPQASFLTTRKGVLKEKAITKADISSFKQIALENMKASVDNLNKLIYLRRLLEFENVRSDGTKGDAWNLLSNLFHRREKPTISGRYMTTEEIKKATEEICEYIKGFDYVNEYEKVSSREKLIEVYRKTDSNYEKLQIYRIIHDEEKYDNPVVKKFVNELFHVENDFLFQLNPKDYDTVPQYIIDECEKYIESINTITDAG